MALDIDRYAHLESPLTRWDARFKILSLGGFILAVALLDSLLLAAIALALSVALLASAGLPFQFVSHGLRWVVLFLTPFLVIIPLTYPGEGWFAWAGLRLGVLIVLKALAIVLTAYAIFGTTRFDVAMVALQRLRCPSVLVQMLLFTYRYLFVFIEEMRRMEVAMRARGFVPQGNLRTLRVYGGFVGTLLVRSFERTERIYKAMLAKGYQGELRSLVEFSASGTDYAKAALVIAVVAALAAGELGTGPAAAERGGF